MMNTPSAVHRLIYASNLEIEHAYLHETVPQIGRTFLALSVVAPRFLRLQVKAVHGVPSRQGHRQSKKSETFRLCTRRDA